MSFECDITNRSFVNSFLANMNKNDDNISQIDLDCTKDD